MAKREWDKIYDTMGDSEMEGCSGAECLDSCCRAKDTPMEDSGFTYITTMFPDEFAYQEVQYGPFEDVGVIVESTSTGIMAVYECIADDGSCKLKDRKPLSCRLYPFSLDSWRPVSLFCPRTAEIVNSNGPLLLRILQVRQMFGLFDHYDWGVRIKSHLDLLKGP